MKFLKSNLLILLSIIIVVVLVVFTGGYTWWNNTNPEKTCASCHEISPMVEQWQNSAHRNFKCSECHGTALSNGWHSLSEKVGMITTHVSDAPELENLRMTEQQVLGVSERCSECHQKEHAEWSAGRHSTTYADIFLNKGHNELEPPYWDCFRCHGMFYDGDINDLMERPEAKDGHWKMLQPEMADVHAIPCLACHQSHSNNKPIAAMKNAGINTEQRNPIAGLYIRTDKRHRRSDQLLMVDIIDENGRSVEHSNDPASNLCKQCHAPNAYHHVGSEDDRTPVGIHEGISCVVCHDPHSNAVQNACDKCHTLVSPNCKQDVRTMNTSYFNPESTNNIHYISCTSCHDVKIKESLRIENE